MRLIGAATLTTTSNAMLNVTAIALVTLMAVPLTLFLASIWADRRLEGLRRRAAGGRAGSARVGATAA